jgi:hypothetical protein
MSKVYKNEKDDKSGNLQSDAKDGQFTEVASGTCFSSVAEQKLKQNQSKSKIVAQFNKLTNAFTKSFLTPNSPNPDDGQTSKWKDLKDRTIWTILLLLVFIFVISLGNFYCAVFVLLIIMAIYHELLDISRYKDRNTEVKNYYLISWYFFIVCIYYFYIKTLVDKVNYLTKYAAVNYMLRYHNLISFLLYMIGFFIFIKSLTKGYYRYQFRSFAWIHILLFIFGISSSLIMANIFNGLFWYIKLCLTN